MSEHTEIFSFDNRDYEIVFYRSTDDRRCLRVSARTINPAREDPTMIKKIGLFLSSFVSEKAIAPKDVFQPILEIEIDKYIRLLD